MIRATLNKLRIYTELPMLELQDRNATQQFTNQLIAPVVYQTWEDRFVGKTHFKEIELFRALNPELDFKLFDRQQRESYMREYWGEHPIYRIFTESQFGPMKADIFRYCLLYERGGFYFDISKGCSIPLGSLLKSSSSALISFESHDCVIPPNPVLNNRLQHAEKQVLQWGMGFAKGHPILQNMIENICCHYPLFKGKTFQNPKNAILRFTGPGMFTKTVREYFDGREDESVAQAGVDFMGAGIFALKGSWARYSKVPSYVDSNNQPIVP
jgi:mannosyltransferase OCH1-like enzyme